MLNWLRKLHFHQWKVVPAQYFNELSERLGITDQPATRTCSICGKHQVQDIHCLGLNPPEYVTRWIND